MGIRKILPAFILVTVFATFANSKECPSLGEHQNCECKETAKGGFEVRCQGNKDDGINDINKYKSILQEKFPDKDELDLYFENFLTRTNLTSKVFDGLRVRKLSFSHCRIGRWADKEGEPAFLGLEDSLEEIEIKDSIHLDEAHYRKKVPPFTIRHIRWLRKFTMTHNTLYSLADDWFSNCERIEEIDLENNEIQFSLRDSFNEMTNLRVLNLADNKIENVPYLHHTKNLEKFDLSRNKLNGINRGFFMGMTQLKEINVSGNPLRYLLEGTWKSIWSQLESIDVSDTHLHCDQHIDWMIHEHGPLYIRGACATPGDVAGKQLRKVIADRRKNGE